MNLYMKTSFIQNRVKITNPTYVQYVIARATINYNMCGRLNT